MKNHAHELLSELASNGDGYGLDIQERMRVRWGWGWFQRHSVHPRLRQLESKGWLRSYQLPGNEARGWRPIVMYAITEAGVAALGRRD